MNYNNNELDKKTLEFYKRIGNNVKRARQQKDISQMQLAQLLNYKSTSSISNPKVCYNKHHFSIGQLYKISLVLEIDIKSLLD